MGGLVGWLGGLYDLTPWGQDNHFSQTLDNNNKLNFIIYHMVESTLSKVSGQLPLKRMLLPSKPIYHMLLDVSHTSNF